MPLVLSLQALTEQLDPVLRRAGYAPYPSLRASGEPEALIRRLAQETSALWIGAPWGSVSFIGVRQADQLDAAGLAHVMDRVFETAFGLLPWTGQLVFASGAAVQLGVFGRILFVWESPPRVPVEQVQRTKRGQLFKKCYVVPWSVVLPERRIYGHKGLPLTMGAPSVSELQRLLNP